MILSFAICHLPSAISLAQLLPDPSHFSSIGWVIVILVALAAGVNQIADFFDRRAGKRNDRQVYPQPLQVEGVEKPVSERACVERHLAAEQKVQALEASIHEMRAERRTDMGLLHEKINKVDREVSGLKTAVDFTNQNLASVSAKLDRMIEK